MSDLDTANEGDYPKEDEGKGSYEEMTIYKAVWRIHKNEYLLPSFQRKFVWSEKQIVLLFDSIMQGYPISTFMFWHITDSKLLENRYYEFHKKIAKGNNDTQDPINPIPPKLEAIIDGQQRLTALYIGLNGSYHDKHLYLNLCVKEELLNDDQMLYDFQFLSDSELRKKENPTDWYKVKDIMKNNDVAEHIDYMMGLNREKNQNKILNRLFAVIHTNNLINYYQDKNQDIEYIMSTFTRVNDGGKRLEKADLIFSFLNIGLGEEFRVKVDTLMDAPSVFKFDKDFVLKTILAVANLSVGFKIQNFDKLKSKDTKDFPEWTLENHFDKTSDAILTTFELLSGMGYSSRSIKGENFLIPVVYYLYHKTHGKKSLHETILSTSLTTEARDYIAEEKKLIDQWILLVNMKKLFGNSTEGFVTDIRDVIRVAIENKTEFFPLAEIKRKLGTGVTRNDIEEILKTSKKESRVTSVILEILQHPFPIECTEKTHLDHLHATALVAEKSAKKTRAPNDISNNIGNIALMPKGWNGKKSDKLLAHWLAENNNVKKSDLLIPDNISLELDDFEVFIEARRAFMQEKLEKLLGVDK
jgi:uncharacterized protein with ParB-like and HNH nuclease domain